MTTADEIKALRTKTGLSQVKFAEKLGIPVRTLQNWENEVNSPADYVFNMICNAIKMEEETVTNYLKVLKIKEMLQEAAARGIMDFAEATEKDHLKLLYDRTKPVKIGGNAGYKIVLDCLIDENHHDAISYYEPIGNIANIMVTFTDEEEPEPFALIGLEDGTDVIINADDWDIYPLYD